LWSAASTARATVAMFDSWARQQEGPENKVQIHFASHLKKTAIGCNVPVLLSVACDLSDGNEIDVKHTFGRC